MARVQQKVARMRRLTLLLVTYAWIVTVNGMPLEADREYVIESNHHSPGGLAVRKDATKTRKLPQLQLTGTHIQAQGEGEENDVQQVDPYGEEVAQRPTRGAFDVIAGINEKFNIKGLHEIDVMRDEGRKHHHIQRRVATNDINKLWPGGRVSYQFAPDFPYTSNVKEAMSKLEHSSCIYFEEDAKKQDRLYFVSSNGCWSFIGRSSGKQLISIGPGCQGSGAILHELLHSVGFYHEQSRPDRDQYVTVNFTNVIEGKRTEFEKRPPAEVRNLNQYDYESIMHYSAYMYSANGRPTMTVKGIPKAMIGQRHSLSPLDVQAINILYNCPTPIDGHWSSWGHFTSCSKKCGDGFRIRSRQCTHPSPRNGGAACQGRSFEVEKCNAKACGRAGHVISCNFELDFCHWTSPKGTGKNSLRWSRQRGSTPSVTTGPSVDHTTESTQGSYVFVETSAPALSGHYGLLMSPVLKSEGPSSKRCITYWMNCNGRTMGELILIHADLESNTETVVRSHLGNHGNIWYLNEVTLDAHHISQVIFKGIRGLSWESDIALDDIHISSGKCQRGAHWCDFEGSLCQWTTRMTDQYPLLISHDSTPTPHTGPVKAASGQGYIYAEASSPATQGDKSSLLSPFVTLSNSHCLWLSYHMSGSGVGALRVFTEDYIGQRILLAWFNQSSGDVWKTEKKQFTPTTPTRVVLEMERGISGVGDIAIDDVDIVEGEC